MTALQVSDADVDSFFRCASEASTQNATRAQRRRLAESASSLWRNLVSGGTGGLPATPNSSGPGAGGFFAGAGLSSNIAASASGSSLSSLGGGGSGGGSATSFRAAKEQGAVLALTSNATTGMLLRPRALGMPVHVEIRKTTLSETERWKLQAALRREETKASGEKYNQNMLKETKLAKPPTPGEAFPAGRGKPVR